MTILFQILLMSGLITVLGLSLFHKDQNEEWEKIGGANTPLGLIDNLNFKIESINYIIEDDIISKYRAGEIDKRRLDYMMKY